MKFILRIFVNGVAIWVASLVLDGLNFQGNLGSLIVVGLIFGLVNALIRPVVKLLTLPITLLTLGLFALVINALMLILTAVLSTSLELAGNFFEVFITALLGAIVISLVSMLLSWILPD